MRETIEVDEAVEAVHVRGLRPEDFEAVVAIDAKNVGRRREEFFRVKLAENLAATGLRISLAAELPYASGHGRDRMFVGFLLARVFYGEFGRTEPAAALDTLAVHPDFQGRGVAAALLEQLKKNLRGLGVGSIQTEVSWDDPRLMSFFQHEGFRPAARLALDLPLG
jgi:GNAT superfamily N-acetyltransferase